MKKSLVLFLICVVISFLCITGATADDSSQFSSAASNQIAINAANFPDPNFRDIIRANYSIEGNYVDTSVSSIDVSYSGITDLTGIEHFKALEVLFCQGNQLTDLNVSNNTALICLECGNNHLTSLNISSNRFLEELYCYSNLLSVLRVTSNSALHTLSCGGNQLSKLDITYNPQLIQLCCDYNQLTKLDVTQNPLLEYLICGYNQLTALDVSNNTALIGLSCGSNQLAVLDVSHNIALMALACDNNQLTALNISSNRMLEELYCYSNNLSVLRVTSNAALSILSCGGNQLIKLDVSYNHKLVSLQCDYNLLTTLDVSGNTMLTELYCSNNQLTSLDLSNNARLTQTKLSNQYAGALRYTKSGSMYQVNLRNLPHGTVIDMNRVIITDGGILDTSSNIVSYTTLPAEINYEYDTQNTGGGETMMSVAISEIDIISYPDVSAETPVFDYGQPELIANLRNSLNIDAELRLFAGDINSDGFSDVAAMWLTAYHTNAFEMQILLNDGKGDLYKGNKEILADGTIQTLFIPYPDTMIILNDLNSDGKNDLYIGIAKNDTGGYTGYQNEVFLSDGEGILRDATVNLPQRMDYPHSIASADIDNDGDIDIYVGNIWSNEDIAPYLLINDGLGRFSVGAGRLPAQLRLNENGFTASVFTDVNNDSFPDLILGDADDTMSNQYSSRDSLVLLNDGQGKFKLLRNALPTKPSSKSLVLSIVPTDLNIDGWTDLVFVFTNDYTGRIFKTYINNQDGTFRDETGERLPDADRTDASYCYRLFEMDVDHDGDLDLVGKVWNDRFPTPLLFINDGNGCFTQRDFPVTLDTLYFTFLDLDNDGGNDIVYGYYGNTTEIYLIRDLTN